MRPEQLLIPTPQGLYCPPGDFHIDPLRAVPRALITHGHSDHARAGNGHVMATRETLAIMAVRMGANFAASRQAAAYGEEVTVNGVTVSFHPAGHVLGSAQIRLQWKGLCAVISGDYARATHPAAEPFEPVACNLFITEATFGLPVFRHPDTETEIAKLVHSVKVFPERAHLIGAYALGKAQRLMALLRRAGYHEPVYAHGAVLKVSELYRELGIDLGDIRPVVPEERKAMGGRIVICPPSATQDVWAQKFPDPVTAFASGWMRVKARARQRSAELPLVISDHADWYDLCATITETGAEEVWVTHGQEDALVHWCGTQGIIGQPLRLIGYGDDNEAD